MPGQVRLNIRPSFRERELPCEGKVGDLVLLTPLAEDEFDPEYTGSASLWLCVKADYMPEGQRAVWVRFVLEGRASCGAPVAPPQQDIPELTIG